MKLAVWPFRARKKLVEYPPSQEVSVDEAEEQRYKPVEWPIVRRVIQNLMPYRRMYLGGLLLGMVMLILDDATAAIDPETEDFIRKGMRHVMRGRTTFLIAHRISSVKTADVVLVVEEGRITQMGTHVQLMKEDGHYREIAAAQLYGYEAAEAEAQPSHMKRMYDDRHVAAGAAAAGREERAEV